MRSYSAPFVDNGSTCRLKAMISPTIPNLFHEFPGDGSSHRLADFGDAAGQAEMAEQRCPGSAHDERPAAPKHCRRDRLQTVAVGLTTLELRSPGGPASTA